MQAESIIVSDNLKQPERFLDIAYHEAAHCVIAFIFHQERAIRCIDMRRTALLVRSRYVPIGDILGYQQFKPVIISLLAGPAAHAKKYGLACKTGLDLVLFIQERIISPRHISTDFRDALLLTEQYLMRRMGRDVPLLSCIDADSDIPEPARGDWLTYRVLYNHFAGWAVELMEEPGVWHVVSALADRLEPEKVMPGRVAWKIMCHAWGEFLGRPNWGNVEDDDFELPVATLGDKWSRRLL